MRDLNRLDTFYNELKEKHKNNIPDWRFGQFMMNFILWHQIHYKSDIFYLEENDLIMRVEEYINELF